MGKQKRARETTVKQRDALNKRSLLYLKEHSKMFGFGDWDFYILDCSHVDNDFVAESDLTQWIDKKITVSLFKQYYDRKDWELTLIHELIHASLCLMKIKVEEKTEKLRYLEEEEFVNNLSKLFHNAVMKR